MERFGRVRWLLVFWIFVLGAVAFLDRINISIAGRYIASEYHFSNIQLGYIFSSFLIGYALFQTPGGRLADKLGARLVISMAVIWWGLFTVLTACLTGSFASALLLFISVRFLLGAGEAVFYPASNQFVTHWIPAAERGAANGLIFAGVGVGAGITPPFVTYLMVHYGWRSSFWASAAIGIAAGVVWFLLARDTPSQHPWVSSSELVRITSGLTISRIPTRSGTSPRPPQLPWKTILKNREVFFLTLSYFTHGYAGWIFFSWFFIYLAEVRGMNLKASSHYAMLPFLAMTVGSLLGGMISDRLTVKLSKRAGRCYFSCGALCLAAVFLILGSTARRADLASVVLAGGAGALFLCQSSYWSVSADIAGSSSGAVSGFMNMGAQAGGAATASLTPMIAAGYGWTASFLTAAGLCTLGGLAWLMVNPDRKLAFSWERSNAVADDTQGKPPIRDK